ncbi:MAG: YcaO-like family protein, partial [Proteobacteria bacterium]|nr:YcaO-like family protein [Pseudomonadota bacterium]
MQKKTIRFQDCLKTYTTDQDKAILPEDTVARFKERLEHLDIQILKEVKRIDNGRLDIPVFFSVCGEDAQALTGTKKQMGKGGTPEQSEASALMELVERFSFFTYIKERAFLKERYGTIKDQAIAFESLALCFYDQSQDLDKVRELFE